ncbi:AraC family transcriptional regulator [Epilithonimonas sp. JDS]|uniref:helix-turn-helix domain-containing protein n=1 Tax=Epilithonimonas sp. JDS TaxID=2902797 RepID=UPI001E2962BA|nr:AraC family transcriptional regulator [Epilithonimonas sp. JDS]MCD9855176.1 AraC family transcriptional regulator [Epilithonimonas sp. JDS]
MSTLKEIKINQLAKRFAILLCVCAIGLFTSQTQNDVSILREEVLDKMQYSSQKLVPLLKYYSKISPADAQILRIKSLLIKGDYEEATGVLSELKEIASDDRKSKIFFYYQYLYAQLCQDLGFSRKLNNNSFDIKDTPFPIQRTFPDLAIDRNSFDGFSQSESISMLRSASYDYEKAGNSKALIQSTIWLAELLDEKSTESVSLKNYALTLVKNTKPDLYYEILVFNFLAKIELEKHNPQAAYNFLKNFQSSASGISNIKLKADYYRNLAKASAGINQFKTLEKANSNYFNIIQTIESKKSVAKAMMVNHLNRMNEEKLQVQKQVFQYIYFLIILIFIIAILLIYWLKFRSKPVTEVNINAEVKNFVIPDKTEKRILNKLEEFEKNQKFIQKTVSLKTLSQQFDTNPKYLSEVVNKHKNSNFNTYINDLRIDYIVTKIRNEPEYRKYKVSYLADECGFSSHSLFTTIFKNRMNVSPTEFLQKVNE